MNALTKPTDLDEKKTLVLRYFDMWNTGDGRVADAVLGAAYLDHAHPAVVGPAAVRALVPRFRAANPDARFTVEEIVAEADVVAVRSSVRRMRDGQEVVTPSTAFFRIGGGQLVEQWSASVDVPDAIWSNGVKLV